MRRSLLLLLLVTAPSSAADLDVVEVFEAYDISAVASIKESWKHADSGNWSHVTRLDHVIDVDDDWPSSVTRSASISRIDVHNPAGNPSMKRWEMHSNHAATFKHALLLGYPYAQTQIGWDGQIVVYGADSSGVTADWDLYTRLSGTQSDQDADWNVFLTYKPNEGDVYQAEINGDEWVMFDGLLTFQPTKTTKFIAPESNVQVKLRAKFGGSLCTLSWDGTIWTATGSYSDDGTTAKSFATWFRNHASVNRTKFQFAESAIQLSVKEQRDIQGQLQIDMQSTAIVPAGATSCRLHVDPGFGHNKSTRVDFTARASSAMTRCYSFQGDEVDNGADD